MQRILTLLGVVLLFGVGLYTIVSGSGGAGTAYEIPADPVPVLILLGAILLVVVLTVVTGGGLAYAWNWLSAQLAKAKPGPPGGARADASQVTPYTPRYSYQAVPESAEARQWIVGSVIGLALLGLAALSNFQYLSKTTAALVKDGLIIIPTAAPAATATPVIAGPPELLQAYAALPAGDAAAGQATFATLQCANCHVVSGETVVVGPSLAGVGTRAATRRAGYSPEIYIYESITQPGAYVVEGFADGLMPATFKETLTPQQLADLIAYLKSLN